jgi:hypothetical protein
VGWAGGTLAVAATGPFPAGERLNLFVPSEFIAFADGGAGENVVSGTIEEIKCVGDMTTLTTRVAGAADALLRFTVSARERAQRTLAQGTSVRLRLLAAGLHLIPQGR